MDGLRGDVSCAFVAVAGVVAAASGPAVAQTTTRVSVDSAGAQGNFGSFGASLSADGRFVAFDFYGSNLVPGDTNGQSDCFVHDRETGETTRVSLDSAGGEGNGGSAGARISADGRFVAFVSTASNLVSGDTNGFTDCFVHDRETGETTRVSVDSAGAEGNSPSFQPTLSADGRFVAFMSEATDLVAADTNGARDVFLHDRVTGETIRVSVDSQGGQANQDNTFPSISTDGRFVAFSSLSSNLVPGDTNDVYDVFVHDRVTAATSRMSLDSAGGQGNGGSFESSVSADGRFVAFSSLATDLVESDTNGVSDVFMRDGATGVTSRVSESTAGGQANGASSGSGLPSMSPDGRFILFVSDASSLAPADTNAAEDVFVHDQVSHVTTLVSVSSAGAVGNSLCLNGSISADGQLVAFDSSSTNLVAGDTNDRSDVFVHDLRDPVVCRAGTVNAGTGPIADVLLLNGSAGDGNRFVTVPISSPIQVTLNAAPSGPGGPGMAVARYVVWVWSRYPSNAVDLSAHGEVLGCTVNPTPFRRLAAPQPFRCLRGTGVPAAVCGSVPGVASPARAPWTFTRAAGFSHAAVFTFQGILEDAGASNPLGFSVTNAVILKVE
jgi:Tol biopolymer transport system component